MVALRIIWTNKRSDDYWNPCDVTSTAHIVENLQQQQQPHKLPTNQQHDDYWQWETWPERARDQLLSGRHIQANLERAAQTTKAAPAVTHTNPSNDDYWAF